MSEWADYLIAVLGSQDTYLYLGAIVLAFIAARMLAGLLWHRFALLQEAPNPDSASIGQIAFYRLGRLLSPLLGILLLKLASDFLDNYLQYGWIAQFAITVAVLYVYHAVVRAFVSSRMVANLMLLIGVPILGLQSLGILSYVTASLETIYLELGNIRITLLGVFRVAIFGSLIFWLGRVSSNTGQEAIRKQEKLDFRTREVAAKLYEIGVFVVVMLLLLQVMGVNLTALAVFSGAVGVGLGFGLQSIASNFISGLIILLDRSLAVGDFIELEDGRSGYVTALNMRSTTLETFEGKDIVVPNEVFITTSFVNWTRKNQKQRYRVDFSVAYGSDIRKLVEVIKAAVATHPQVLSGEAYPIEERPDCEIDSFGDSGVNMFVEFWIEAIDDGKNRVGGDLLLIIYETMAEHGFTIPFPQREVRILNEDQKPE